MGCTGNSLRASTVEATSVESFKTHMAGCPQRDHPWSGSWFNIKMISYQYRNSHCGDKTILRPSYLHNGISYTGKTTSLYWLRALAPQPICTTLQGTADHATRPGVGVTKPIFSVPLFSQFCRMMKTVVTWMISSSYLAGVTAAELRRHLANMNIVESIWHILLQNQNFP